MTNRTILITGASAGMGKETALRLIKEGHVVYGAARRAEKMQDLAAAGGHVLALDVTDHEAVAAAVARVIDEQGRIDVLINNAGYAVYGAVEDISMEDARRQFEVNLFGVAALTKEVLPHMRKQGSGKIINVSSMGGKMYTPLGAWYHATKHALEGWSDCLRIEVEQFGIEVVIVEPGAIDTEFAGVMMQPMLDRSSTGPYAKMTEALAIANKNIHDKGDSSPPSVIADVMCKAIRAKRPKTRYVAGKYARPMMTMRKWLGDRAFDKIMLTQIQRMQ